MAEEATTRLQRFWRNYLVYTRCRAGAAEQRLGSEVSTGNPPSALVFLRQLSEHLSSSASAAAAASSASTTLNLLRQMGSSASSVATEKNERSLTQTEWIQIVEILITILSSQPAPPRVEEYHSIQAQCLAILAVAASRYRQPAVILAACSDAVMNAMEQSPDSDMIQYRACTLISVLQWRCPEVPMPARAVSLCTAALRNHKDVKLGVHEGALMALALLSRSTTALDEVMESSNPDDDVEGSERKSIGQICVIAVLDALRENFADAQTMHRACLCIAHLSRTLELCREAANCGGIEMIADIVMNKSTNLAVMKGGCLALARLIVLPEHKQRCNEAAGGKLVEGLIKGVVSNTGTGPNGRLLHVQLLALRAACEENEIAKSIVRSDPIALKHVAALEKSASDEQIRSQADQLLAQFVQWQGLPLQVLATLPVFLWPLEAVPTQSEPGEASVILHAHFCRICLEPFKQEEQVQSLPCAHTFHKSCVGSWLSQHSTCPECRCDVVALTCLCDFVVVTKEEQMVAFVLAD